jgi:hypothetical protein
MDPEAVLQRVRDLLSQIQELIDENTDEEGNLDDETKDEVVDLASEAVDAFDGLDSWMSRGGFLPSSWRSGRNKE